MKYIRFCVMAISLLTMSVVLSICAPNHNVVFAAESVYEAEDIMSEASNKTLIVTNQVGATNNSSLQFLGKNLGDYISFSVPVPQSGDYHLKIAIKKYTAARGIFQLSIDGSDIGNEIDFLGPTGFYIIDFGNITVSNSDTINLTFTAVGTNSNVYYGIFDYISIEPVSSLNGFVLSFEDNFDGTSLNTDLWNYRTGVSANSSQIADNVSVSDGNLIIHVHPDNVEGQKYSGGGVITKQAFGYGWYESRMKLSVGTGWHPSFWTSVWDGAYPKADFSITPRIEIDINEFEFGHWNYVANNVYRWYPSKNMTGHRSYALPADITTAYHTWACEYTPTKIDFYLDGSLINSINTPDFPFNPQHVWLSCIGFNPLTSNDGYMYVDYFRYYTNAIGYAQNPYETTNIGYSASCATSVVSGQSDASGGTSMRVEAKKVGDYIDYNIDVPESGTYTVLVGIKNYTRDRGIYQLSVNGNDVGAPIDQNTTERYLEVNLGTATFSAGTNSVRFTVTGTTSGAYQGIFDYIKLDRIQ